MVSPVAVFDAGIGSYDLVRRLQVAFPEQDLIYFADRAAFPYSAKTQSELLEIVTRASQRVVELGAETIVLASNAPSVTVLDQLRPLIDVPIIGIKPPVRSALAALPLAGELAVAGAKVMIESDALSRHIVAEVGAEATRVIKVVGDQLIGLVESGAFLVPEQVLEPVAGFVDRLIAEHPQVAGISLSSTHLPWLSPIFSTVAPQLLLFDPADTVVSEFAPYASKGSGQLCCFATQSPEHPIEEFEKMIAFMGLDLQPILISHAA